MLKLLYRVFLYTLLFVAFITFGPSGLLLDIQPLAIDVPFPKSFTGPYTTNDILSTAQKLFLNQIDGPESIAVYNGSIFTASEDGFIYKVDGNNLKPVVKLIINEYPGALNRISLDRPLGMKFDSTGVLYVVEPSHGIYSVENILTNTPIVKQVLDIKHIKVLGKQSLLLNDLAIDENGGENGGHVLYISDISTKYTINDFMTLMADSDFGRLIRYNTVTKKVEKVIDGLFIPNGVEISDDKSVVLFVELGFRRIFKHYIRGPKAGQTILLLSELPGQPDNIRRSATKRETYWLTLAMCRNESSPLFVDTLNRNPLLKKFFTRLIYLVGSLIDFVGTVFGNYALRELGFGIKSGQLLLTLHNNMYEMVIEFDLDGNILQSLHSPDGSVSMLSEAREVKISDTESALYLGSFMNKYVGKLVLKNRV